MTLVKVKAKLTLIVVHTIKLSAFQKVKIIKTILQINCLNKTHLHKASSVMFYLCMYCFDVSLVEKKPLIFQLNVLTMTENL